MIFKSKVDKWIYGALVLEVVAIIAAAILVVWAKGAIALVGIVLPALLGLGFPLWLLYSIRYEVTLDKLIVYAAWAKWEIPKVSIHSVKPGKSYMSSPALSLDRLEVRYGNDEKLYISPLDKEGFLKALGVG
mgnify:CR=1 FL=1